MRNWLGPGKHFLVFPVRANSLVNYVGFVATDELTRESWSAPGDPDALRREFSGWDPQVEAILQAGVDAGEFREIDPWLTARAWLGMHNYTYLWLQAGGRVSARDVAKPFHEVFLRGIERPT